MGGFTIVPLAQKARTQTLIVDSDLNLGNYDLLCTDAKGDTAEFDEFVGGVGNFTDVIGSGNLDIEGIASITGNTQIDGNIVLEGAINNVNIADNGEITTSQGVNGADFNGAVITSTKFNGATIDTSGNVTGVKGTFSGAVTGSTVNGATITSTKFNGGTINSSGDYSGRKGTFSGAVTGASFNNVVIKSSGTLTVTPTSTFYKLPCVGNSGEQTSVDVLPWRAGVTYTGKLYFKNTTSSTRYLQIANSTESKWSGDTDQIAINANTTYTYTFTNAKWVICGVYEDMDHILVSDYTLT